MAPKDKHGEDKDYTGASPDVDDEAMIEKLRKMNEDANKEEGK